MRLGEAMVKEAVINNEQLARALERQIIFGGRLGTNLVEIGAISEEELARFLSRALGVPYAEPDAFKNASADVIAAFPKELAEKYTAFPLKAEGKRLHIAMKDPNDVGAVDELGFILGLVIKPYIASEIRILYSLEKHYGIKRDLRYVSLLDEERRVIEQSYAAPPASQKAPPAVRPEVGPAPGSTPGTMAGPVPAPGQGEAQGNARDDAHGHAHAHDYAHDYAQDYDRNAASASSLVEGWESVAETKADAKAGPSAAGPVKTPEKAGPAGPGAAPSAGGQGAVPKMPSSAAGIYEALAAPGDREEVAGLIVSGAALIVKRAALFLVKGSVLTGWRALGGGLTDDTVKGLSITLDGPSVFKEAVEGRRMYKGPVLPVPQNDRLLDAMGGPRPQEAVTVPLIIKDKVVGVLYGDDGDGSLIGGGVDEITGLMGRASMSLEILILKNKILGGF